MLRLIALLGCLGAGLFPLTARAELPDSTRFSVVLELGNIDQARAWLDEGLAPDFEGTLIGTGLMIGAREGNIALMELFLGRGADIHRVNRFGETALMLAAWKNQHAAMQWLLDRGARVNRAEREWTALHYATFAGHADLVERLLTAGADINARSTNGSTVVMMAAREGHVDIAKRLIEAGANPALKNDFDDDAVAWAMRQGHYAIAKTFTSAENFAELARAAAAKPVPKPLRSVPAPDIVEEYLRMARLAEAQGKRDEALNAYRKALAELRTRQAPQKVGAGGTAKTPSREVRAPSALTIRAKRGEPARQSMALTHADPGEVDGADGTGVDRLLDRARAAEMAGKHQEALKLFRAASARIKTGAARE